MCLSGGTHSKQINYLHSAKDIMFAIASISCRVYHVYSLAFFWGRFHHQKDTRGGKDEKFGNSLNTQELDVAM